MSERYTTARIPYARARGAPSLMTGTYDGADLASRSARPGAYDAMRLPSLMSGRRSPPAAAAELATAEAELEARKAELALWQSYVAALEAWCAFQALANSLRSLLPPESMPAL